MKDILVCDTLKDMVEKLDLNTKHWINEEAMKFIDAESYDNVKVGLFHFPQELENKKLICKNGHRFTPDWLQKTYPYTVFYKDKGIYRLNGCNVKCPVCNGNSDFNINFKNYKTDLDIFGDEAFRTDIDNKSAIVYSFVAFSGSKNARNLFILDLLKIKHSLVKSLEPFSWTIHMKELMNPSQRDKKNHLSVLKTEDIKIKINEILQLINKSVANGDLNLYSAIGIVEVKDFQKEKKMREYCKTHQFNAALLHIIRESTLSELAPKFYFEESSDDGWAEKLLDSGRCTLVWPYITHGIPVMSPKFVSPSYSIFLEIADILAYVISRYLFFLGKTVETKQKKEPEFLPSQLGTIRYILTDAKGDLHTETSKNFPLKKAFKNTNWDIPFQT